MFLLKVYLLFNYNCQYFKTFIVTLQLICLDAVINFCIVIKIEGSNLCIVSIQSAFIKQWRHLFGTFTTMDLVECPTGFCRVTLRSGQDRLAFTSLLNIVMRIGHCYLATYYSLHSWYRQQIGI